jgi:putative membrane protein
MARDDRGAYVIWEMSAYKRFDSDDLILRDELAIDRPLLANERTLLAYLRSGVALLIAGVSIIHFSQEGWFWAVGIACIPTGIITGIVGVVRYLRMNKAISCVRNQARTETKHADEHAKL